MVSYTHYFHLRLPGNFSSNIKDFERAFAEYCAAAPTDKALQEALFPGEDLQTVIDSVEWQDTDYDDP